VSLAQSGAELRRELDAADDELPGLSNSGDPDRCQRPRIGHCVHSRRRLVELDEVPRYGFVTTSRQLHPDADNEPAELVPPGCISSTTGSGNSTCRCRHGLVTRLSWVNIDSNTNYQHSSRRSSVTCTLILCGDELQLIYGLGRLRLGRERVNYQWGLWYNTNCTSRQRRPF